ncbi:MAG: thioredoxin family protein [Phycisphaeraceae bacterium]|nr:thioredoxin family protein [Phycisphaeraceae bacterium]
MKTQIRFLAGLLTFSAVALAGSLAMPSAALADPAKEAAKQPDKDAKKDEKKAQPVAIGQKAPDFTLTCTDGKQHKLADLKGKIVVLEWFNPECPGIVQHHKTAKTFNDLHKAFKDQGVVFLAINSGAKGKQGHGKELNQRLAKEFEMPFPVLLDESGTVGKAYGAKTTPHCFIIDKDGMLVYNGAIDNGRMGKNGDRNYVREALEQVVKGETVTTPETRPYGCSVKYAS